MFDTVFGLPVHALVVHATVVIVPLAALVLVPVSTESGEALERRLGHGDLIERHAQLAEGLLPWVIGLVVAAAGVTYVWWSQRRPDGDRPAGHGGDRTPSGTIAAPVLAAVIAVATISALGTTVQVIRIGHSGAEAAWSQVVS